MLQTDIRRQTDCRWHIANVNMSSRSLKPSKILLILQVGHSTETKVRVVWLPLRSQLVHHSRQTLHFGIGCVVGYVLIMKRNMLVLGSRQNVPPKCYVHHPSYQTQMFLAWGQCAMCPVSSIVWDDHKVGWCYMPSQH